MKKGHNNRALVTDPIQEAIAVDEQFSKRHVAHFRYDPSSVRQRRETASHVEGSNQYTSGAVGRVLEDVSQYRIEGQLARLGPNYLACPSNHLRRSSEATCS